MSDSHQNRNGGQSDYDFLELDPRQVRGIKLARTHRVKKTDDGWLVRSQTGPRTYTVTETIWGSTCTCQDFIVRGKKCKHLFAVDEVKEQTRLKKNQGLTPNFAQNHSDDSALLDTKDVPRPTYRQNWQAYNKAQTREKYEFQILLHDLCSSIEQPEQLSGRPRVLWSDAMFAAVFKVYSTFSGRRFMTDLRQAHRGGYLTESIHYNSMFKYMGMPEMTPVLQAAIVRSSLPLRVIERDFAADATGFGTTTYIRWLTVRHGNQIEEGRDWLRAHIMCGVKTHVVTSVVVTGRYEHEAPELPKLLRGTAQNFTIEEFYADKGYSGAENLEHVVALNATPYIPFPEGKTGKSKKTTELYMKHLHYYNAKREEFLEHYHKRSNVESVFSSMKRKFSSAMRSKSKTAQMNELLCKILAHNICVLIQQNHEMNIPVDLKSNGPLCP